MLTHTLATAVLVALIGLAVSAILAVSSWALAPHASSSGAATSVRLAAVGWLYAHHVPVDLPEGSLGLTPLGLLLVPAALSYAGGRQLARSLAPRDLGAAGRVLALFALSYGLVLAVVAGVSAGDGIRPHPLAALAAGAAVAAVAAGFGLLRASGLLDDAAALLPHGVRQALAGAVAAVALLVGTGAVVVALLLTVSFPEAVDVARAVHADLLGAVLLTLLNLALLPTLAVWAVSFATGVGFSLGVDAAVTPQGVSYGPLPVLPALVAVPPEGPLPGWTLIVLVLPLAAGALAGLVVHRRLPGRTPEAVAATAALAGGLAGLAVGLLGWLSAGPLGGQRLASVGPVGWQVGLAATAELSLAAAVVAWEAHRRGWDGRLRPPAALAALAARRRRSPT